MNSIQRIDKTKDIKTQIVAQEEQEDEEDIRLPWLVRQVGGALIDLAQMVIYDGILETIIEGRTNIPVHTNFIVAPNHASHLDTGLVKKALGKEVADQTVAVAAADYWFDTTYKRAFMNNFTTLVPIERSGNLRQALRHVTRILNEGYNALIFPEGTRSLTGEINEFKPIIGYLVLNCKVGILPVYLWGTYEAFPKGTVIPKRESFGATSGANIGKFLEYDLLAKMVDGIPKAEAYRLIAARVQHEVENLRDGKFREFDIEAVRKKWKAERRKTRKQQPLIED